MQLISVLGRHVKRTMGWAARFGCGLLLFLPSQADAGGTSFAVRVVAFERPREDAATFTLEAMDQDDPVMPSCPTVRVVARYGSAGWAEALGIEKPPATRAQHRRALDVLHEAYREAAPTRFGVMGEGLAKEAGAPACEFHSKALLLVEEDPGAKVPYSFAKWP